MRTAWGIAIAAVVLAGAAEAAETLTAPAYPTGAAEKTMEVNVVATTAPDAAGKPGDVTALFNDGSTLFEVAATGALAASSFDAGRTKVTVWYLFKLVQKTEVHDISPDRLKLDVQPALVTFVAPTFPPGAPSLKTEVALNLLVGTDGKVWYAEAADGGADPLYVDRAVAAAKQFAFEPGGAGGKPTACWYQFVLEFK